MKISLKFIPKSRINHIQTSVKIMAWRRPVNIIAVDALALDYLCLISAEEWHKM